MKGLSLTILWMSLCGPMLSASPPDVTASRPSPDQLERDTKINARVLEYRDRLEFLFRQRVDDWSRSFLARRHGAIQRAGEALATEAAAVRTARRVDWNAVGEDPDFRAFERAQVEGLLEPRRLREELTSWAKGVEQEARDEMVELFRQLIAEDLGQRFDQQLRGQVIRAVREIPLETLVKADADRIEARIRSGLPATTLTRPQRVAISMAAGALASVAGAGLAGALGMPSLADKVAALAALVGQWLADLALEAVDREVAGEPQAAALATQLEVALKEWQDRQLRGRLETILHQFGNQLLELIEGRARKINWPELQL